MARSSPKSWPTSRTLGQEKKQSQEPFPWMWIPLLRVREKKNKTKGKAKVSPKVSPKAKIKGRVVGTVSLPKVLQVGNDLYGINSHGISSHGKRTPMIPRVKAKVRKAKTKAKAKVIKAKIVSWQTLSLMLGLKSNNLQLRLVINLNQKLLRCIPWKKLCHQSQRPIKSLDNQNLVVVEVLDELHQAPSKGTVTRSAMMMAQNALAAASGSNAELFGKMIAQAESAVKEA